MKPQMQKAREGGAVAALVGLDGGAIPEGAESKATPRGQRTEH